uniref:F-box protein At3g26010-like beta-propeller domain-containing protein n=1 Tax=Cajanus cajan TaxID=3821 RepID=A0A151SQ34_CAJCA|nr:hypothetical protein KK1_003146 [Cajanus cajan]
MPYKSTVKCKCVCKRWLKLLSIPYFLKQFVSRQYSLSKAIFTFISPSQLMLTFPPPDLDSNPQAHKAPFSLDQMLIKGNVCGYSNGLFLYYNNRSTSGRGYFVYDPLTKVCTHIAPFPDTNKKERIYAIGFLSITSNSTRRFLVVIVNSFIKSLDNFSMEVFFSHTGNLYFMGTKGVFVIDHLFVVNYTIDYPEDVDAMNIVRSGYLGCSGGTLKIADINNDNNLRVWELIQIEKDTTPKSFYPTWQLVHKTNLSTHLPAMFCANYFKRVAGFHPYDGDIVYLHSYANGILVANLRTNKFEHIPGHDKLDISPFQLELPLPPLIPSADN